jgi:transposase-like protein
VRKIGYDARKRGIAEALALGSTTGETARHYGVSDGRISQMRREFERDWNTFQGEN